MIKRYNPLTMKSERCSANQKAKSILLDVLENSAYWDEDPCNEINKMSEKEIEEINKYLTKQQDRLRALLSPEFYAKG